MKENVVEARKWMREFFFNNPHASIDTAAREATRCHKALHKSEIQDIRRKVKESIEAAQRTVVHPPVQNYSARPLPAAKAPIIRKKAKVTPFNPPRIRLDQSDPEKDMTVDEALAQTPVETPPTPVAVTPPMPVNGLNLEETKIKWTYDFCEQAVLKNPRLTIHDVNKALQEKFGTGLFTPKIKDALYLARDLAGITYKRSSTAPPKPPPEPPVKEKVVTPAEVLSLKKAQLQKTREAAIKELENIATTMARAMKAAGANHAEISIDEKGGVHFDFDRNVVTTTRVKLEID